MAKRKKIELKPVRIVSTNENDSCDLASIQEDESMVQVEVFLDPCSELEIDLKEVDVLRVPSAAKLTPKSASWVEEVEKIDFQASAKDAWSKINVN
uniref:Uncharacterized protein n=1 Tax=Cannabis sativa TaxID=3483 RepID=A0A803PC53_CANSA